MPPVTLTRILWVQGGLAFIAGFVDATGFVALAGLFTAHVTGNFVLIGAELARGSAAGVLGKLLALPVFMAAVAATRILVVLLERGGGSALRPLLVVQALALLGFLTLGIAASPIFDPDAPLALGAGMAGVFAMGIQNAKARLILAKHTPTTVMTGNTTQAVIDLLDLGHADRAIAARERLARMVPAIAAFALGAVGGAFAYGWTGFTCLTLPILLLIALAASTPAHLVET